MDLNRLGEIKLGSFFDMGHILYCAVSGLQDFKFSKLMLSVGGLEDPVIQGYFSGENRDKIQWIFENMFDKYRDELMNALPLLLDSTFREIANGLLPSLLDSVSSQCSAPQVYPADAMIDFRDLLLSETASRFLGGSGKSPYGDLFRTLYDLMNEKVFRTGASNRPMLNDLLRVVTTRQSNVTGDLSFLGNVLDNTASIKIAGLEADIGLTLFNVAIENVDRIGNPLDLLRPIVGVSDVLSNTASFGVDSKPLSLTASVLLSLNDGGKCSWLEITFGELPTLTAFLCQFK
jgi:hypothetical protein